MAQKHQENWAARTPDDFILTLKASRFLTHIKRLKDPEESAERFMKRARLHGCALRDARQFASITENLGLKPTRVAESEEVAVG